MDLETLALAVDELVRLPAAERRSGRLFAVRCTPDAAGGDNADVHPGESAGAVVLELLAEGEARTLPHNVQVPAGVQAIALASGVWAAPLDDRPGVPPSQHPDRRRAHLTVLVAPEGDRDAVDVSVLRYGDGAPAVLRGGAGLIHQRLVRCWSRRPEAPWASKRLGPAA
ncbi:MAG: hypothetical protein AB1679_20655 [Actinomycetota bacterium]